MSTNLRPDASAARARRVGICGGGVAGLTLAARLARLGFAVTVLEAREEAAIASEGVFLTLAPNGMNGLRAIDLDGGGRGARHRDHRHRDPGRARPPAGAHRPVGLRGSLRRAERHHPPRPARQPARYAGARRRRDGAPRRAGRRRDRRRAGVVVVTTEDGETLRFDLLAACDGLGSRVRGLVFPEFPEPRFTGLIGTGGFVEAADVPSTNGTMRMTFGREAFFGYIKAERQPVFWFNSYAADAAPGFAPEAYAAHLRALHRTDPQANRDILAAVERVDRDYPIHDLPELPVWHRGRVVLVGDAAHAVGPHAGQGASMAIEDAVVLAACLDREPERGRRVRALPAPAPRPRPRGRPADRPQRRAEAVERPALADDPQPVLPLVIPLGIRAARRICAFRVDRDPLADPDCTGGGGAEEAARGLITMQAE